MANEKEQPKRYDPQEREAIWQKYWEEHGVFAFAKESDKEIFSIDTPPPTVSGKIHMGHAFSYAQQDFIARFQRMRGKNVLYPFGTDDNGIASERLVEKKKGIKAAKMDRDEFIQVCLDTLKPIRQSYIDEMKRLGMSCDFTVFYSTINEHCRKVSQKSFIELYLAGREYRKEAPFIWCTQCQTAISQVECEDQELPSHFNDILFKVEGEEDLVIGTTRPEYLGACVAVFFHPDDKRYESYLGKKAKVPLYEHEVPIMTDESIDPEKGTGIMMVCTFGDQEDAEKYLRYNLPLRELVQKDGRFTELGGKYAGMKVLEARKAILADLDEAKLLLSQKGIKHAVKVHERCGTPIEFVLTKQWFIKYLDLKDDMLKWGADLNWYPQHMKVRYDNWIKGLGWDWCISRQRYAGIPFPVWFCKECDEVILAKVEDLPVDPLKDKAPVSSCPKEGCNCTEFIPDKDVMDTWATSSLTPQIVAELMPEIKDKIYPMTLRPQAHDIITFWLFNTVVKSQLHHNVNPFRDVIISGHGLDPKGRKMSKSKGNVVEPMEMVSKYSADGLRFWAATSKMGDDLPFMEKDLVTGAKFATKLWNASKFCTMHIGEFLSEEGLGIPKPEKFTAIDEWLLSTLHRIIHTATQSFEQYEYFRTKQDVEQFFWMTFCDNYLELVKDRLYNPSEYEDWEVASARWTLYQGITSVVKMMAPITPYITEEIYQLYFKEKEMSVHLTEWPHYEDDFVSEDAERIGKLVLDTVASARKAKSNANVSLKTPIKKFLIKGKIKEHEFALVERDIKAVTKAQAIVYEQLDEGSEIDYEDVVDL